MWPRHLLFCNFHFWNFHKPKLYLYFYFMFSSMQILWGFTFSSSYLLQWHSGAPWFPHPRWQADKEREHEWVSYTVREKVQQECWGFGFWGEEGGESAEKSRKWGAFICLPTEWAKKHLVVVCERKCRTEYLASAHHRGHWSSPGVPQNDYQSSHPGPKSYAKEQEEQKMGGRVRKGSG